MSNPFLQAISEYDLIHHGDRITVALSGGADSVSLLHMLVELRKEYDLMITAAHVNHMMRGIESDGDELFCKNLCKKLGVELFVKRADVPKLAKEQKISSELCGRNVRYEFFEKLSQKLGSKVATAHTLSDCAETLIFNLARGTSLSGLCSIPPKRDFVIRPLILCTEEYIREYCAQNLLEYVTDSSNLTDDYTRNRIRHNVIPLLKEINPQFENAVKRLSDDAKDACSFIDSKAKIAIESSKTEFGWNVEKLMSLDRTVRSNAISQICKSQGVKSLENTHIRLIEDKLKNGGAVDLCGGYKAVVSQKIFRIIRSDDEQISDKELKLSDLQNGIYEFAGKKYSVKEINADDISKEELSTLVSIDVKNAGAVLRTRRAGDKFTFCGRNITKPLRKAMNELKIPAEARDKILVLAIDNTVLWCENIGASQQGMCSKDCKTAIKIEAV